MEKEKLIKLAEDLYQSAFDANAYYAIMMQYREMSKKYNDEMNLSPAFYQVVYGALQKACFMEIAKLYDKTKDVVDVYKRQPQQIPSKRQRKLLLRQSKRLLQGQKHL